MKAYVVSLAKGIVKIENNIFEPLIGKAYAAEKESDEDITQYPAVEVDDASFDSARIALNEVLITNKVKNSK